MIIDAFGQVYGDLMHEDIRNVEEEPNPQVKKFFEMLAAAQKPLYEGSRLSVLEMASRITSLKCEYNLPHRCVDSISSLISKVIPNENSMSKTYYDTKKVVKGLELPHEKIHACPKGCMLFWKDKAHLEKCSKCGGSVIRRLLVENVCRPKCYSTSQSRQGCKGSMRPKTLQMKCSGIHKILRVSGTLAHPSDSEAWKHLDNTYKDFASEPCNVRLGLCTDGFSAHGKFRMQYSCWPVIVTPYNLPPCLCMMKPFMFLSLLIPGPKNPKGNLDVYMQPLIDELKSLWEVGTMTYDVSTKQNFKLRAALLWTVSDFPAFGMLSGWTTSGKMACLYCMDKHISFWLEKGSKVSWFDSHCQFLPPTHLYRKNRTAFFKKRAETRLPPQY
ncbi:uncharacterized protein LOC110708851 [Chenopodium quinoa]|uniref:uncharacterized protein LOC110708851 n=1 Tax=Chenopodium quinoa TaxID=63459 RepID=UPI000B79270F|nr:uncharacterized protein LOC110708851 [Chenopodium quinoa]